MNATSRHPLDIGFLCTGWAPDRGGIQSHTDDLAQALIARGHKVAVLCLDTRPGREPFTLSNTVERDVRVRRVAYGYGDHSTLPDLVNHARLNDVVLGWMAETPCDVIHVHHVTGFGAGAIRAIHDVGQPLVLTLHDYWLLDPRGQLFTPGRGALDPVDLDGLTEDLLATWPHLFPEPRTRGAARELVERVRRECLECLALPDALFTPSGAARDVFERAGVAAGRIGVVENGVVESGVAMPLREPRAPGDGDEVVLGVVGSVLPSKGVVELAEAVVAAQLPNLVLEVHGDLTPYHGFTGHIERLNALARDHASIRISGPFERIDLPRVLSRLDAVAAPSIWEEVYGLSVREARAAGLPVLVSDAGGLPAVVADGSGLVVPRGDHATWVGALQRLVGPERERWAAVAPRVHSVAEMALELERHYEDAIEHRTGQRPGDPAEAVASTPAPTAATRPWWKRVFGA